MITFAFGTRLDPLTLASGPFGSSFTQLGAMKGNCNDRNQNVFVTLPPNEA